MAENVFIHYGSYCYDPARYVPVRNCSWKPKPEDGTGLWASRENLVHEDGWMNYGWKEWCEDSGYRTFSLKRSFRFRLRNGSKSIILKDLQIYCRYLKQIHGV